MKRLEGKTALVTGCNRGIGEATVELFAKEGANIICAIRKENSEFKSFTEGLKDKYGVEIEFVYFDMTDEAAIKTAMNDLTKRIKNIDILVNNAGIPAGGLMSFTSIAKIKEVFQVNFFSQIIVTQIVTKLMMRRKTGSIINMSSVTALDNMAGWTSYGSSKGAIISFTKTIARELAPFNIRANAIAPGLIDTSMGGNMDDKSQNEMIRRSDMNRKGRPEEIANAILFLASDESSYITGQVIRVDGGM